VTIDNHLTTLPLKKGLSSSAAVCVLVVRALGLAYGLELSVSQVWSLFRVCARPISQEVRPVLLPGRSARPMRNTHTLPPGDRVLRQSNRRRLLTAQSM